MDKTEVITTDEKKAENPAEEVTAAVEEVEKTDEETVEAVSPEKVEREKGAAINLERTAEYYAENRRFDEALINFREALHLFKKIKDRQSIGRIHYRIGFCQENMQKYNDAYNSYREAKRVFKKMENMNDYSTVSNQHGKALYFNGKPEEAVEEFEMTLALGAKNEELSNNLGFIQIELGQYDEARKNLLSAIETRESKASEEIHMSMNNLGVIEFIQGNYDKAEEYFKKGMESDARDPREDRTVQYTVFMKPEFKGETFSSHRVFHDVYTKASLMINLASTQGMKGDMKTAMETCSEALTMDQDHPYLYEAAGWLYINNGEEKRALDYFRRALPYDSANEELKQVIDMINPYISQKVGRNDPCPCGSGKKYKKCHGAGV